MDYCTHSYLGAPTGKAVTVEVGDGLGQRASQHLKLLPADHMMRQVVLQRDDAVRDTEQQCPMDAGLPDGGALTCRFPLGWKAVMSQYCFSTFLSSAVRKWRMFSCRRSVLEKMSFSFFQEAYSS